MPIRVTVDFPDAHGRPARRLFRSPQRIITTNNLADVTRCLADVAADCEAGAVAIGFVSYEAAPAFDAAFTTHPAGAAPLLWFAVFETEHAAPAAEPAAATPASWDITPDRTQHGRAVARIREEIAAGSTYQVNYTGRMRAALRADPLAWYESLRRAQGNGYHVCIETDDWAVVSLSPELFFETAGGRIRTRPMKGTRPRGRFNEEDHALMDELRTSGKERAENLMIVDLMRNDLGRVAQTGSVQVTRLYDVERYPTVLQLTSTVEAMLRPDVALPDVMTALFPPGSVTGAPKISTMQLIAELEDAPRGVYCGAIGVVEPGRSVFNVPIRTLWLDRRTGAAEYGTGGGITADSVAEAEYDELLTKARILAQPWPPFDLLETMRYEGGEVVRLAGHLARIEESAEYFSFPFCEDRIRDALASVLGGRTDPARVRLLLAEDGGARVELGELYAPPVRPQVRMAPDPVDAADPFLFHKTTARAVYDAARTGAGPAFDALLFNQRGEITEFTRGNVVVELDGRRYTPPRTCGLLAGVFREELLRRGEIEERVIDCKEIAHAAHIWFVNSVREWIEVELV